MTASESHEAHESHGLTAHERLARRQHEAIKHEHALANAAHHLAAAIESSDPGAAEAVDYWQDQLRLIDRPA